ncbi:type II toxin-antitoxin system RelE/ParE family toxin [Bdellovibrio sp. HCB288]|uniref:type II toxin-antitoxin system RelE/ParE family toxin n=1 Tax=Bdellovibrio sp. HCB288 TaxID=3394355 RepID=UPI0039B5AA30
MIGSFGNRLAKDLFEDLPTKESRKLPSEVLRRARMKLFYLDEAADLNDLKIPPGNKLEALKGDLKGFYSIRINDQWRIIFKWQQDTATDVSIVDYHK